MITRRALGALTASLPAAKTVQAQEVYPSSRPITIVVPFGAGAGTGTDVITRVIAEEMARSLRTSIIIDNKAGASGQLGTEFVARARPEGYTLLVGTNSTHSGNPFLFRNLRYDPVSGFTPIGRMTINPLAFLVRAESPFRTAADLLGHARANPGRLSYGYGNTGGQVSAAMLVNMGRIDALAAPYRTTPQAFADLMGGRIDFTFVDIAASQELIESGKLRALAVTGNDRFPTLPDVPPLRETPGLEEFSLFAWLGLLAPAGTPEPVVTRLNAELRAALERPDVRGHLQQRTGSVVEPTTVAEFTAFMAAQRELWRRRIGEAGVQPE
ncbi:Bug family tripartite tricarboxylate transporter substrate binding protein [Muricoccus pecuniae]|uniref:Tripartite-type tricarboxylate transporter receptor subunit TctC n=1 Tax=Muricoccus pecuniae TaxID=693023 RepID=A0A840YLZ3_9PROT|nr:tripartite tricarboxylate transporter substrate binding protein [Roseomonas pecuniae]MBB5696232.1 tripartite-type tricarboxylate transporter receptor subunit TctC [Roseomonas pecuniae]